MLGVIWSFTSQNYCYLQTLRLLQILDVLHLCLTALWFLHAAGYIQTARVSKMCSEASSQTSWLPSSGRNTLESQSKNTYDTNLFIYLFVCFVIIYLFILLRYFNTNFLTYAYFTFKLECIQLSNQYRYSIHIVALQENTQNTFTRNNSFICLTLSRLSYCHQRICVNLDTLFIL